MGNNSILLSICIPTYNRLAHVNKIVEELLKCKSNDFNIYIIDNCSNNGEKINSFNDSRVYYILRDFNVDGRINLWDSVKYADGKYRMFCIDRDIIKSEYLEDFLEILRVNEYRGGICVYDNYKNNRKIRSYKKCSFPCAYGNRHPSGNFVRWDVVSEEYEKTKYYDDKSYCYLTPFYNDFLVANSIFKGDFLLYDSPLVYTAMTQAEENEPKSNTYSPSKKNLYFFPEERLKQMRMDIIHLNSFNLNKKNYKKYIKRTISSTIENSTFFYKDIMNNSSLCDHYYLETRIVGIKEIFDILKSIRNDFYKNESICLNNVEKKAVYIYAFSRALLSSAKVYFINKIKRGK